MFSEFILFLFLCVSCIDGKSASSSSQSAVPYFRDDYSYNEEVDGWLKLHIVPATWSDARILCRDEGAILASPLTGQLHKAISDHVLLHRHTVNSIFLGVHTTYSKGVYTSVEGVPLSKISLKWAPGEPNNFDNSESCLVMLMNRRGSGGTVGDVKCNDVYPFVCYKKRSGPIEITQCGTHDKDYKLNSVTGKCYKLHRYGRTWDNAYRVCMAEGGHLAIPNSEQEFLILRDLFTQYPESSIFSAHTVFANLGFSDPNDGGSWITIHGQTLQEAGFDRWEAGKPNNSSQPVGELCGALFRGNAYLYDVSCQWSLAFICEKEPAPESVIEEIE